MRRIILHWTAGRGKASALDRQHYHFIIEADGSVVAGDLPPEANENTNDGSYAAHTLNCNTGAIGLAVAGMWNAKQSPFDAGPNPLTQTQVSAMVTLAASLCRKYDIPVDGQHVLSHAEVQPTLGIKQKGKWDITWLPGMDKPGDPVKVGDTLRDRITRALRPATAPVEAPPPPPAPEPAQPPAWGFWQRNWWIRR